MFKFLHAADIHLDSPLRGLDRYEGCPSDEIRGATRRALDNLVELAITERVAFVLIAGDVYDGDWKNHDTGLRFVQRMTRLREAGIPVYLIRGNHDAQNKMTYDLRLPDNVTSLKVERPETCVLEHLPVKIHGQGFASQRVCDDLASRYPAADPGCWNLGLLHTSVDGREGHGHYAPCTVESLRLKGYGYWALGHIHKREILDERDGPIAFPGNIQGRNIRESGAKGCLLVTVEGDHHASCEFRSLDVLRWENCRLDASDAFNLDDVAGLFEEALPGLVDGADGRLLALRVEIIGKTPAHDRLVARSDRVGLDLRAVANDRGSGRVWVEKVKVRTRSPRLGNGESDGPFEEIDRLLDELRLDDRRLEEFAAKELGDLRKKLPPEVLGQTEGVESVDLADPAWLRGVLDQVRSVLLDQFEESRGAS